MTTSLTVADLPGRLGQVAAELGDRARLHDLYDEVGGRIYDDSTLLESSEIRVLRGVLRRHPGPVLELAAGSGRITLPMLTFQRQVTALELNESMIELLRENVEAMGTAGDPARLTIVRGDMRSFELGATFSVVVIGAASASILDSAGRVEMFRAVNAHLAVGGRFLFSVVAPLPVAGPDREAVDVTMDLAGRSGRPYRVHEFRETGQELRWVGVYPITGLDGGPPVEGPVPVCVGLHRMLDPEQVRAELETAGLDVVDRITFDYPAQALSEVYLEAAARQ